MNFADIHTGLKAFVSFFFFSATPGGILDRAVDAEDEQHKDFLRLVCYCAYDLVNQCSPVLQRKEKNLLL